MFISSGKNLKYKNVVFITITVDRNSMQFIPSLLFKNNSLDPLYASVMQHTPIRVS